MSPPFIRCWMGARTAAGQDYLVTLGIMPTFASTGFGYIQKAEILKLESDQPVFRVKRFVEKAGSPRGGRNGFQRGVFLEQRHVHLAGEPAAGGAAAANARVPFPTDGSARLRCGIRGIRGNSGAGLAAGGASRRSITASWKGRAMAAVIPAADRLDRRG